MTAPVGTLRLQFHAGFTFDDAAERVPYYADLGVSHVYASPIQQSRRGSTHGYDGTDPTRIDSERGGRAGFERLVAALRRRSMGILLDIVPNHLSTSLENRWWYDVLEHGRQSSYADFFAIDWAASDRVVLPFLRDAPHAMQQRGALALRWRAEDARLVVDADGVCYPFGATTYASLLATIHPALSDAMAGADTPVAYDEARLRLAQALTDADLRHIADARLASLSDDWTLLSPWLDAQAYRLCDWREASRSLNWRRFFDIAELVALQSERDDVFEAVHALVFDLYGEGLIDGVRIDHIDGLANPQQYCARLRARFEALQHERPEALRQDPAWIVAEKILAPGESLRTEWPIDGSTGYDFMDQVGALLHDPAAVGPIDEAWFAGGGRAFGAIARDARAERLTLAFAPEFARLVRAVEDACPGFDRAALSAALQELLIAYSRYRGYARPGHADPEDTAALDEAVRTAAARGIEAAVLQRLQALFSGVLDTPGCARALLAFQQLTAPLAARALEDTAFYRYNRLLSRNEVGADPAHFSCALTAFHAAARDRGHRWPRSLLATATHDHKRGEDARLRLATLTDMPRDWTALQSRWLDAHAAFRTGQQPDFTDRTALYQTLLATWPMRRTSLDALRERIATWWIKAMRERKQHGSWAAPDQAYEAAALRYLDRVLDPSSGFAGDLDRFLVTAAPRAALRGLAQVTLRYTTPGVPDLYQGTEFWDLSLVDPDNRRAVDYPARIGALAGTDTDDALLQDWKDGRVKQRLIARLLACRTKHPALFEGTYQPVALSGPAADAFIAFQRCDTRQRLIVVVPIRAAAM
ncbi:MAG: malto-oligosyltrehalose synthase, partial [Dokdonella sp.]